MVKNRVAKLVESTPRTGPIHVMFVKLAEPVYTAELNKEMTLREFLNRRQLEYSSAIRVNKMVVDEDYVLKDKDIVTMIGKVTGGC